MSLACDVLLHKKVPPFQPKGFGNHRRLNRLCALNPQRKHMGFEWRIQLRADMAFAIQRRADGFRPFARPSLDLVNELNEFCHPERGSQWERGHAILCVGVLLI